MDARNGSDKDYIGKRMLSSVQKTFQLSFIVECRRLVYECIRKSLLFLCANQ